MIGPLDPSSELNYRERCSNIFLLGSTYVECLYNTIWLVNSSLYFYQVRCTLNVCIIRYDWLIALYLFISLVCNTIFKIRKQFYQGITQWYSIFLQTQLQKITVEEHIIGKFALATLTFGLWTSPTDTFPFTYLF